MQVGVQRHAPVVLETVTTVQEGVWAPKPVWMGAGNLVSTGFRFPDRPARSESLY